MVTCEWCKEAKSTTIIFFNFKEYSIVQWRVCTGCAPKVTWSMEAAMRQIEKDMGAK